MSNKLFCEKSVTRNRLENCDLLKYARDNREEGFFNNVSVKVEDLVIKANRMVLACNSQFFEALFKANLKENNEPVVDIRSLNGASVKAVIDYIYEGTIDINSDTVIDLLAAADYLKVEDVKKFCSEFLESVLSPKTSINILNRAKSLGIDAFTNWIYQYISNHLDEVALTSDFKCQSKKDLVTCVSRNNVTQARESSKYHALMSWIRYDEVVRKVVFAQLFQQLVDLNKVSITFNKEVLLNEKLIRDDITCYEQVLTSFSKLLEITSEPFLQPTQSKVVSLGGNYTHTKVFDLFNLQGQPLLNYPDLPQELYSHCSLNLDSLVFCFGGKTDLIGGISNSVWQCNLKQQNPEWREIASMNEKRCDMGAVVQKDQLVVSGGNNGFTTLDSAEYYKVEADEWKPASPMNQRRETHALVSCDDCVYALGGKDKHFKTLSSVEILQDLDGQWQEAQSMQTPRHSFAAVNCNGTIYAIGGQTEASQYSTTKSVERFDAATDSWIYVKDMGKARFGHSACVLNGKIVVVGGQDGNLTPVMKIECYDPSNDTWSNLGAISDLLVHHAIVAV